MKKFKWVVRSVQRPEVVEQLRQDLNDLPVPLARALALRGIESLDKARLFFRPSLDDLFDPFLMKDMASAADRVADAIRNPASKVLVYGDYDVDGTTATALMLSFLRSEGVEASYFIPDRFEDGYGLCEAGIDYGIAYGADLIIALDCGITGHDAIDYATSKGVDLIVCDHHTVGTSIPNAVAVLDPKRPDCEYPFKELSGCGVGFKLIQAVLQRLGKPAEIGLEYLDFVALSIASDIVPILGENRVLMIEGLKRIKQNPRMGLRKLAEQARIDLELCSTAQIVFGLGPRINAAGRLGNARRAVDLLIATDEGQAAQTAAELEQINLERRMLDKKTLEEAVDLAEKSFATPGNQVIVLHQPEWHLGVIGIVASRLVDRYYRPTILLCSINGEVKGSARSINGFNIYDALKSCEPLLLKFGGHKHAAGMTLDQRNVEAFKERFNEVASNLLTPEVLSPEIHVDSELSLHDITPRFWGVLRQFAPFGPENKNPVFFGDRLNVVGHPTIVGQGGHLKFRVMQKNSEQPIVFEAIGFGLHEHLPTLRNSQQQGRAVEMLFSVEENNWNGQTALQLRARDLRLAEV